VSLRGTKTEPLVRWRIEVLVPFGVFTAPDGAQLHPEHISALFARLVRTAALPPIPLHGLRHTYASLALANGVNAAIVSRRLGHATVAFTLDIYSHVLPQVDADAAEVIAAFAGH
jgi:integrase